MALDAADKMEILELAARYNHAIDFGDGEAWAGTFTEDGVFNGAGPQPVTGHVALAQFVGGFAQNMAGARHWTNNHVIDGDGESATHTCYLNLVQSKDGSSVITGVYTDKLSKVDGQWRFTERNVTPDAKG